MYRYKVSSLPASAVTIENKTKSVHLWVVSLGLFFFFFFCKGFGERCDSLVRIIEKAPGKLSSAQPSPRVQDGCLRRCPLRSAGPRVPCGPRGGVVVPSTREDEPCCRQSGHKNLSGDLGDVFKWDSQFKPVRNEVRID